MARRRTDGFTEVELDVMKILWEQGPLTSSALRLSMPGEAKRKESTMRTILAIMERKGFIGHRMDGRSFVYFHRVERETAQSESLHRLLDKLFQKSPALLVGCLVESVRRDRKTLEEIEVRIGAALQSPLPEGSPAPDGDGGLVVEGDPGRFPGSEPRRL